MGRINAEARRRKERNREGERFYHSGTESIARHGRNKNGKGFEPQRHRDTEKMG